MLKSWRPERFQFEWLHTRQAVQSTACAFRSLKHVRRHGSGGCVVRAFSCVNLARSIGASGPNAVPDSGSCRGDGSGYGASEGPERATGTAPLLAPPLLVVTSFGALSHGPRIGVFEAVLGWRHGTQAIDFARSS